jgi:hypothetical protein
VFPLSQSAQSSPYVADQGACAFLLKIVKIFS